MESISRAEAIRILVEHKLKNLAPDAWGRIRQSYRFIADYAILSDELRKRLNSSEGAERPDELFMRPKLAFSFLGAQTSYLIEEVSKLTGEQVTVTGEPEKMFACECCRYRTLRQIAECEICDVCFWENDGVYDPTGTSLSNEMTLEDAQRNFELFGTCREQLRKFIDQQGPRKYPRAASGDPQPRLYRLSEKECPCCGQGGLDFLTCRGCGLLFLECDETDIVYPDPRNLDPAEARPNDHPCPNCTWALGYWPATPEEILKAGFSENEFE